MQNFSPMVHQPACRVFVMILITTWIFCNGWLLSCLWAIFSQQAIIDKMQVWSVTAEMHHVSCCCESMWFPHHILLSKSGEQPVLAFLPLKKLELQEKLSHMLVSLVSTSSRSGGMHLNDFFLHGTKWGHFFFWCSCSGWEIPFCCSSSSSNITSFVSLVTGHTQSSLPYQFVSLAMTWVASLVQRKGRVLQENCSYAVPLMLARMVHHPHQNPHNASLGEHATP